MLSRGMEYVRRITQICFKNIHQHLLISIKVKHVHFVFVDVETITLSHIGGGGGYLNMSHVKEKHVFVVFDQCDTNQAAQLHTGPI